MKSFEMNLKIVETKKGERVERIYKTELKITDETCFSEIVDFMGDIKNIWKKSMNAVKRKNWMELEVIVSSYDNWLTGKPLVQKSFDRWVSVSSEEQDEEGIYLRADTRYTPPESDMYLTKDTLKDLAFTLG